MVDGREEGDVDVLAVSVALVVDFFRHNRVLPDEVVVIMFGDGGASWVEHHARRYAFGGFEPAHAAGTVDVLLAKADYWRGRVATETGPAEQLRMVRGAG